MKNPVVLIWMLVVPAASPQFSQHLDDTCQSFLQSIEKADDTMDQSRPQEYNDIAEDIYAALNNVVVKVGLSALSLPQDAKSRASRSLLVVRQCRKDINLMYHNAVSAAYVELRKSAGLSVDKVWR